MVPTDAGRWRWNTLDKRAAVLEHFPLLVVSADDTWRPPLGKCRYVVDRGYTDVRLAAENVSAPGTAKQLIN